MGTGVINGKKAGSGNACEMYGARAVVSLIDFRDHYGLMPALK